LENVKQVGNNEWCANCPSCGDTKRHLYISGNNVQTVLDCKKGCSWESVLSALNLEKKDVYVKQHKQERWETLRTHEYTSKDGNRLAVKTIYRKPDGSKTAIWHRYEGNTLVKGLNGLKMPLYHVDKLTDNTKPVFIVEGEKDVETLEYLGYRATTSPNGAGSHWRKDFNQVFKDYDVVILADNDEVGLKYATEVADNLIDFAKSVKLVPTQAIYSGLKPKGDISDVVVAIRPERTVELLHGVLASNEYLHTQKTTPPKIKALDPSTDVLQFDDTSNADLFISLFGEKVRFNYVRSKWLVYQDTHWEFVHDDDEIGHLVDKTLEHMATNILPKYKDTPNEDKYLRHLTRTRSLKGRESMLKVSRHRLSIKPTAIDSDSYLFNVQNGTIDLRKCVIAPHKAENYITNVANVSFDPKAKCPLWTKVVTDAMCNDPLLIDYLQRVLGYCLLGSNPEECFFIFYGNTTRNGKSTILETLNYLMGRGYAVSVAPTTLVERNIQGANPELLAIKGARLLSCGELRADSMLNDTLLKMITGNDTISARALYGDVEMFKCGAKLIANTNGLPPLRNNDMTKSGRIHIIPFNRHFEEHERIKDLKERLREPQELSGILNWLLKGYKAYLKNGLTPPPIVLNTVNEYQHDNDKIQIFFEECLRKADGDNTPVSKMYPIYKNWCECSGYKPLGKYQFIEKMKERPEYQPKARCKDYYNERFDNVIIGYTINQRWYQ
jgi:putative DNA primase/helicase